MPGWVPLTFAVSISTGIVGTLAKDANVLFVLSGVMFGAAFVGLGCQAWRASFDLLRQRPVEARRAKAQRGEILAAAPVGFLKTDAPRFEKDPDRRIQEAVALVFQKFGEFGTVRQTLSWFLEHGLQLTSRTRNAVC